MSIERKSSKCREVPKKPKSRPLNNAPVITEKRDRTRARVLGVMGKKRMPNRKDAIRIDHLLQDADAADAGELYHGRPGNPKSRAKALRMLAQFGRNLEDWREVAIEHGLGYTIEIDLSASSPQPAPDEE